MYIAQDPERFLGRQVGNGSCVLYTQRVSKIGLTKTWKRGRKVRGGNVPRHTIIATFISNGRGGWVYGNRRDGSSHAAVFIREQPEGLLVWDQWVGRPVAQRVIRYRGGIGTANNDGDRYWVVHS